jgi:hypothetical protein
LNETSLSHLYKSSKITRRVESLSNETERTITASSASRKKMNTVTLMGDSLNSE